MRDPKLQAFGQRVRELRKERGNSQEQFADLAGLDRSYKGHIDRGEKNITLLKIYQICNRFGIQPGVLLDQESKKRG